MFRTLLGAALAGAGALAGPAGAAADSTKTRVHASPLRVCADPNNLPFSNRAGEGFENRLAELVGRALGRPVDYTWSPQRRGFLRNTLNAGICDLVMGVPKLDMGTLRTTRSYYRSTYVFVSRVDSGVDVTSIDAPELDELRIGVQLIGDDGFNTPPAQVLGARGIVENVVGYSIYGDYRQESPPSAIVRAVANGEVDVAAVWGPLAGYYAGRSNVELKVTPIADTADYLPYVFSFPIAMGVREADRALRDRLNDIIIDRRDEIEALLDEYDVPRT